MSADVENKCVGRVFYGNDFYQCCAKASLEHEGKHFCKRHHPPTVNAKQAARSAAWNAKWDAERAASQKRESDAAEQKRRADLYPELLAACQVAFDQTCAVGRPKDWEQIRVAIAKATGAA